MPSSQKNSHCFVSDELSVHKTDTVADKLNRTINVTSTNQRQYPTIVHKTDTVADKLNRIINVTLANQKHCQVLDSTVNIFSQTR